MKHFLHFPWKEGQNVNYSLYIPRFEELTNSIKQLKNHKKIKDISKVLTGKVVLIYS